MTPVLSPDPRQPRIPPGQIETKKFPVLTHGETQRVARASWKLEVRGLVDEPFALSWAEFQALPRAQVRADFHCVTTWSRLDTLWEGVLVTEIVERARVRPEARFVMAHSFGGYTTNIPLDDFLRPTNLFADRVDGRALPDEHGGPCRLVVHHLYAWKSAKWIRAIEFMERDRLGFWEGYGYHAHGDPWTEERFS